MPPPSTRERLLETALAMLEADGPESLQARKIAAGIGATTMTVYSHFGSMGGLLDAVTAECFRRFGLALAETPTTDDPVTDLLAMGGAYHAFALACPQRYRLMFGLTGPRLMQPPAEDLAVAAATFEQLLTAVRRVTGSGRIRDEDPTALAARMWSMVHGVVLLEIAGILPVEGDALTHVLGPMALDMLVGMGDTRERAEQSLTRLTA